MNSQTTTAQPRQKNFAAAPAPKAKTPAAASATESSEPRLQETNFRIDAPSATEVLLLGEFTEWEKAPVKLVKGGGGVWHGKVSLPRGRHCYRFLVDGQWQDDPNRPGREANPFGTTNSFVEVV